MYNLLIIDGLCILFRSFYAINNLYTSRGQHIGGIYGFVSCILNLLDSHRPTHVIVALDTKQKTWRHEQQATYKSNRRETPVELIPQFQLMRDMCNAFGILCYEGQSCEADDWIASCAKAYRSIANVCIVSTDKDLLQLVDDITCVYDPFRKLKICEKDVIDKWGVKPSQVLDLLSLCGDAADGVMGIKGIGAKTAAKWLNEYGSLDSIIANLEHLKPCSKAVLLKENLEIALEARSMISLRDCLEVSPLDNAKVKPDLAQIKSLMELHDLNLIGRAEKVLDAVGLINVIRSPADIYTNCAA